MNTCLLFESVRSWTPDILQVIALFEPLPLKGHEQGFESNKYRKIGEIKNWRFSFSLPKLPNLVSRQYFFLYGIL